VYEDIRADDDFILDDATGIPTDVQGDRGPSLEQLYGTLGQVAYERVQLMQRLEYIEKMYGELVNQLDEANKQLQK